MNRRPAKAATAILLAAVALALAACSGGNAKSAATPQPTPTSPPKPTVYPLTVSDMLGRSVTINARPEAVAALSPTTVEFVYAVGTTSLTRSSSVDFPQDAAYAKDVGPADRPDLALVAAQKPDLIIADSVVQPQLAPSLEALGVPVLYVGVRKLDDVATAYGLVGQALDAPAAADLAARGLRATLQSLQQSVPAVKPKVLVLQGSPANFYAATPDSYAGDLMRLLGGRNIAAGQPEAGGVPGYTKLGLDAMLASSPDIILTITTGPPGGVTLASALASDPAWASVPAVKNGHVSEIDAQLFLLAPGPRALEALNTMARAIYPGAFSQ